MTLPAAQAFQRSAPPPFRPKAINCLGAHVEVGGEWKLQVLDGRTRKVKRTTGWMKNLITDIGLNRIGAGQVIGPFCRVGTGTTAPANTDTALVSQSAQTSTTVGSPSTVNAGAPDYQTSYTVTFEFALGAVVGNMAEIGMGWASTGATLFSRARIVDGGGSPTTITVLVTEILQATYRISLYPTLTDSSGVVTISGINYNYTSRVYQAGGVRNVNLGNWLGSIFSVTAFDVAALASTTATLVGTSAALTAGSFQAYVAGSFQRDFTISAAIAVGNLTGGIDVIVTNVGGSVATVFSTQTIFTPAIPKDNTKTMNLTWRISWARRP